MRHEKIKYTGDICPLNQKYIGRNFALSPRYRTFKEALAWQAKCSMKGKGPILGDCSVFLRFTYPLRMDIDAPIKPILDALKGVVIDDDRQVKNLIIQKERGKRYSLVIEVAEMASFKQQDTAYKMLFEWLWGVVAEASNDPV